MNVLLIAADLVAIEWLALAITIRGHTTIHASDTPTALQRVSEVVCELVIIDELPGGTDAGARLCRDLRKRPDVRATPIWVVVDPDDVAGAIAAIDAGATSVLARPLEAEQLRTRFEALERAPKQPTAPMPAAGDDIKRLIELIPDPVAIVDSLGYIQQVTSPIEQLLGFTSHVLTGLNIDVLCHPDDVQRLLASIRMSGTSHLLSDSMSVRLQQQDGAWQQFDLHVTSLRDAPADGGILLLIRKPAEHERQAEQHVLHDPATGLATSSLFDEHLKLALARGERANYAVAVILIEVESDEGESIDDSAMSQVARQIREVIRSSDVAARLEGNPFVILADDVGGSEHATTVACRLQSAITRVLNRTPEQPRQTVAIGIATSRPGMMTHNELLRAAELALSRSKVDRSVGGPRCGSPPPTSSDVAINDHDKVSTIVRVAELGISPPSRSLESLGHEEIPEPKASTRQSESPDQDLEVIDRFLVLEAQLTELLKDELE